MPQLEGLLFFWPSALLLLFLFPWEISRLIKEGKCQILVATRAAEGNKSFESISDPQLSHLLFLIVEFVRTRNGKLTFSVEYMRRSKNISETEDIFLAAVERGFVVAGEVPLMFSKGVRGGLFTSLLPYFHQLF